MRSSNRRARSTVAAVCYACALAIASALSAQQVPIGTGSVVQTVQHLHAGQFVWSPEVAPAGPLLMIVNLKTQRALLFRNGVPIGATTVSTGRVGHPTPTGIFTILQKEVVHHSSKYDNAPMPYMERLTWGGVALHAGQLPGYPASHGCIRLPAGFAKLLYGVTSLGMTVVISDQDVTPRIAPTPDLAAAGQKTTGAVMDWHPERSPTGPVSVVISASDQRAVVLRNGIEIGSGSVIIDGPVSGTWAYALRNIDAAGQHWVRLTLSEEPNASDEVARSEWSRFHASDEFRRVVAGVIEPGTTIIVTSDSVAESSPVPTTVLEGSPQ